MNQGTSRGDDDELIRLYRAAAELEAGAPSPAVGDAARAHARVMAASRERPDAPAAGSGADRAANAARWRMSMLGGLAVVGLAGLLVLQFDRGTPQEQDLVRAPGVAVPPRGDAAAPAPATVVESASEGQEAMAPATATDSTAATVAPAQVPAAPAQVPAVPAQVPAAPAQVPAAPAQVPAAPARAAADARSAKALAPAPPSARTRSGAEMEAAAPAMTAPRADDATGASLAVPSENRLAPAARPGAAAVDAHGMAAAGNWPALASRLAAGTPVDGRDALGHTLLMRAAAAGHIDMVRRLLDAGADPRLVDAGGRTAGDWARRADRPDIAAMLDDAQRARDAGR